MHFSDKRAVALKGRYWTNNGTKLGPDAELIGSD